MPHVKMLARILAIVWVLRRAWRMGKTLSISERRGTTDITPTSRGKLSRRVNVCNVPDELNGGTVGGEIPCEKVGHV
jgi:hypothetical protein